MKFSFFASPPTLTLLVWSSGGNNKMGIAELEIKQEIEGFDGVKLKRIFSYLTLHV